MTMAGTSPGRSARIWPVRPLAERVGAEIEGMDLTRIDDEGFAFVMRAWNEHGGLLFRDQHFTPETLVAFSRRFGELDHAPVQENGQTFVPGFPELYVVSNIVGADGRPIGSLGAGEAVWHTDMSYLPNPPDASMLYAIEIPPAGGDTWLTGMDAAWEALPAALREAVRGRSIKHDGTYNSGGYVRAGVTAVDDPVRSIGQPHPIVCAHPRTGRPTVYLGRRRNAYVIGLPLDESESLLDELWAVATREAHMYRHRWRVGDLLLWDNRSTMHRRDPFDPAARRLMHRTQVKGKQAPRPAFA